MQDAKMNVQNLDVSRCTFLLPVRAYGYGIRTGEKIDKMSIFFKSKKLVRTVKSKNWHNL